MRNSVFSSCAAGILSLLATQIHAEESYGNLEDPVVAEVLGTQIRTQDPEEMQYVIMQKLFENYALQNNIIVSQEDIDIYLAGLDQRMSDDRKERAARKSGIQQQLETGSVSAEKAKQLQSELDTLEEMHKIDLEDDREAEQDQEAALKGMQFVAKAFIKQWMINKVLYQQYGGRIIFQQIGPEPLDAIHYYLQEQQQKGGFKILEKSFEAPFWEYYVTDSKHSFYEQGSEAERQAFDQPWWLQKQ